MSALIRRAAEADADAIAALHIRSWQSAYRGQLPDRFLDNLDHELGRRAEFWRTHISMVSSAKHEIWAADVEASVNGFVALGPARDIDDEAIGELYAIYVNPDRWDRGLGTALLTHAAGRLTALGYTDAILWVLESNIRARRFYERAGWTADGRIKIETLPDNVELREVRYRTRFSQQNEESCPKETGGF